MKKQLRYIIVFLLMLASPSGFATEAEVSEELSYDEFGSLSIGHNLTTNNKTLKKGEIGAGTLYAGIGITDQWSMATSIFVLQSYDMFNLLNRYAWKISKKEKLGVELTYFKTFGGKESSYSFCGFTSDPNDPDFCQKTYTGFVMEAVSLKLTYSRQIKKYYRLNTMVSYFHYFDDSRPFSFRMDPSNGDNFSVNLTTLHELRLNKSFYINVEAGFWGLNYQYPYYHAGLTLNFQNAAGVIGLGASTTVSPSFPENRVTSYKFRGYTSRSSVHPEIQMQLFF